MGPVEIILGALADVTAKLGITNEWVTATSMNVVLLTKYVKNWLRGKAWAVVGVSVGFGFTYSALQFWGNWLSLAGATVILTLITSGLLFAAGKGGTATPKPTIWEDRGKKR